MIIPKHAYPELGRFDHKPHGIYLYKTFHINPSIPGQCPSAIAKEPPELIVRVWKVHR